MDDESTLTLFFELFDGLPRQGPGNRASTERALSFIPTLSPTGRILDVGCGTGAQTFDLARICPANITAVDNHAPYIDVLNATATRLSLDQRVRGEVGDMNNLNFPHQHFHLIWSEGAIYFMGFDDGLKTLHPFVKPGGHVAVSELCWLTDDPPEECARYFAEQYPPMRNIPDNRVGAARAGYQLVADFALPPHAWWDDYYAPLQDNLKFFRERHEGNTDAAAIASESEREIDMFRQYHEHYGYVFFVMRKSNAP